MAFGIVSRRWFSNDLALKQLLLVLLALLGLLVQAGALDLRL